MCLIVASRACMCPCRRTQPGCVLRAQFFCCIPYRAAHACAHHAMRCGNATASRHHAHPVFLGPRSLAAHSASKGRRRACSIMTAASSPPPAAAAQLSTVAAGSQQRSCTGSAMSSAAVGGQAVDQGAAVPSCIHLVPLPLHQTKRVAWCSTKTV